MQNFITIQRGLTCKAVGRHALAGRHAQERLGAVAACGRVPGLHGGAAVAHGLLDDPAGHAPLLLAQLRLVVVDAAAAARIVGQPPELLHKEEGHLSHSEDPVCPCTSKPIQHRSICPTVCRWHEVHNICMTL